MPPHPPSLSLSLSLFPLFSPLLSVSFQRRTGRFKYQRRLKSDLYHAESCYLYRLIRDLPVRYFQATPLEQRVDRGANILHWDKGGHRDPNDRPRDDDGEEENGRGGRREARNENTGTLVLGDPPVRKFLIVRVAGAFARLVYSRAKPRRRSPLFHRAQSCLLACLPACLPASSSVITVTLHLHAPPRGTRSSRLPRTIPARQPPLSLVIASFRESSTWHRLMETETKVVSWYATRLRLCLIWHLVNTSLMARQVDACRVCQQRGVTFASSRPSSNVSTDDSSFSVILRVSLF